MPAAATISGDAFRVLFPEEFYARHLAQGTRPDGRAPTEARSLSISLGAIGGRSDASSPLPPVNRLLSSPPCDGSALVRCGGTAAVAAVTFEAATASEHSPSAGALSVSVDFPPLSSAVARPGGGGGGSSSGGSPARLRCLAASVLSDLRSCGSVDEANGTLCIKPGVAVFVAKVDVSFLSSDGGERGVALLAAAAALADARLPRVEISGGNVVRVDEMKPGAAATAGPSASPPPSSSPFLPSGLLLALPVASTLATHDSVAVFDPDASESELAHASVTVVVRAGDGALLGVEGGARRSATGGGGESGGGEGGEEDGGGKKSSCFLGVVPLSSLSQAVLLGRARAAEAAQALAAALEAKKKS